MADIMQKIGSFISNMQQSGALSTFLSYIVYFSRYALPVAAIAIILRCAFSMLRERYEPEVWGYLDLPDGSRVPLRHWECTIGSASTCDVAVTSPSVQGTQLVLVREESGNWTVYDIVNGGSEVNGVGIPEEGARLEDGDVLKIGDCELGFFNLTETERAIIAERRTSPGKIIAPGAMFRYVAIFQFLIMYQEVYYAQTEYKIPIALAFLALFIIMWVYFIVMKSIGRTGLEVEALAFFLSTIGLAVAASATPDSMLKQIVLLLAGIVLFLILGWWMRDLKRVNSMRIPAGVVALGLLALNLVIAKATNGAKNWLSIGGISIQPSELVKILYVYAGAATLDRLYRSRNLIMYIGFSAICVGALALMGDFGSALVFFATFLVISFMRSGSIGTVLLAVSGAGLGGFLALSIKPYIAQRFANWGHVWEDVNGAGFQQTRAMSAAASGGLFGMGAGNGWLHKIFAADTDLVYGLVCEELGLIIAICAIAAIIVLAAFTVHNAVQGRSSFYVITGCAAVSLMMVQLGLNVFGALDILPFTGVTFPFVSVGGSSLISCWAMLAYIKATDTRKGASFTIKDPTKMHDFNEFTEREELGDDERNLFDRRRERKERQTVKKMRNRSYFAMIIAAGLVFGLCIFAIRYVAEGKKWVMLAADQSVFNEGVLDKGVLTDRNGVVLAAAGDGVYSYASDATVRKSCFHVVGDYGGNIGSGALSIFSYKLAGYDLVDGVASLSGKGGTVKLSIDSKLNVAAYNALKGRKGAVLVSNYKTGEILCMVSTPSYDPNTTPDLSSSAYDGVYINRCVGATYTPGSVFKLITLAAAIENMPDLKDRTFTCAGSTQVGGDTVTCTGKHGQETIEQALANSCNVAFSDISQELGADTIYDYAKKFGFMDSLNVSGIQTTAGSVDKGPAGTSYLSWMGIGQFNDLISPIAMLRYVSAIANDGVAEEPILLKGGSTSSTRLLTSGTAGEIKEMMAYNVAYEYGAATFPNLNICAKTGTAELGDGTSNAWFVGFLDDEDYPLAFTVVIERGGGGLANAGPVANAVLQAAVYAS